MRKRLLVALAVASLTACSGDGGPTTSANISFVIIDGLATISLNASTQLTAQAFNANNQAVQAGPATWSSSSSSVATVNGSGLVQAVSAGSTVISATIAGKSGQRVVTVLPPGAGAVVTMPGLSFVPFTVTIRRTQSVFFEFPSLPHNVIFEQRAGVPQDIQTTSNVTIPRVFNTVGTFPYDCTLHPGMKGEVVVNP